jgi:hypothetical protein
MTTKSPKMPLRHTRRLTASRADKGAQELIAAEPQPIAASQNGLPPRPVTAGSHRASVLPQTAGHEFPAALFLVLALYASLVFLDWGTAWGSLVHQWHSFLEFLVSGMWV